MNRLQRMASTSGLCYGIAIVLACFTQQVSGRVSITEPSTSFLTAVSGERIVLKCVSTDGDRVDWYTNGMLVSDETRDVTDQEDVSTGSRTSTLFLMVTDENLRSISCRNPNDIFETDDVSVQVTSAEEDTVEVEITEPAASRVTVDIGASFTFKCIGIEGSSLQWQHNGMPLREGDRVLVTSARDVDTRRVTTLLSVRELEPTDAGTYTCQDEEDYFRRDEIVLTVRTATEHEENKVSIVEPAGSNLVLQPGEGLRLMCRADRHVPVVWSKDDVRIVSDELALFTQEAIDASSGTKTSLLTRDEVSEEDTGVYKCANNYDEDDFSVVNVVVRSEDDVLTPSVPKKTTDLVMRIQSSVTLQCSLEAPMDYEPQWLKGTQVLSSSNKYVISAHTTPTILTIRDTEREDVGMYYCTFKQTDTGQVAGQVVFNVTTASCPLLTPPRNGAYDNCPERPLYGERCSFKCDGSLRPSTKVPMVCERRGGRTYWLGEMATCEQAAASDPNVPTSLSHVLLRVGGYLSLQCNRAAWWSHEGRRIQNGEKYTIGDDALVIKHTEKSDAGVYDCAITRKGSALLRGIQKFNVTTVPCPRLVAPSYGSVSNCSENQVYGDTCVFKCTAGFRLFGSRTRTCDLAQSQTHVFWTGDTPVCKDEQPTSWYSYSDANHVVFKRIQIFTIAFVICCVTSLTTR